MIIAFVKNLCSVFAEEVPWEVERRLLDALEDF
jgi:hypothetical protein